MKLSWFPRSGIFLILVLIMFFTPWWCAASIALITAIFIRKYFEVLFLGIIFDALYAVPGPEGSWFEMYAGTMSALVAYLVIEYIRSKTFKVQ